MTSYGQPSALPLTTNSRESLATTPGDTLDAGNAIQRAYYLFKANAAPWILWLILLFVVNIALSIMTQFAQLLLLPLYTFGTPALNDSLTSILAVGLTLTATVLLNALPMAAFMYVFYRGALLEADGHRPDFSQFYSGLTMRNFLWILAASLLVGLLTMVGFVALIVGAFVVAFFTAWTFFFIIDRDMTPLAAVGASFTAVKNNALEFFLISVFAALITTLGSLLCLFGLLVALPVASISSALAYRMGTSAEIPASRST